MTRADSPNRDPLDTTRTGARHTHPSPRHHLARRDSLRSHRPSRERILDDLAAALALLQREEPLLERKFGLGWSDVASVVQDEAARRHASTTAIARLLIAGLRADDLESPSLRTPRRGE